MGLAGKQTHYKKNIQIWKNLNFFIFSTHFRTVIILNKIPWPLQSMLKLGSTVLKIFFPDNTSDITYLYGYVVAELWVTEHSSFMKDFLSFTTKNIHPFNIPSKEIDLFLFILAICKFWPVKFSKTQKELFQKYLLTS